MQKNDKIYIAGHSGLVGSAILRLLQRQGFSNLLTKSHKELDLINQQEVENFFAKEKPKFVFFCAAKVGGFLVQLKEPGQFLYENLSIQNNVINAAHKYGTEKLIFIASFCVYPQHCPQPIKENYILQGDLQYNNEPYGVAKIAGIKLCEFYSLQYGVDFLSVAPVSVYGINDRFDFLSSHVQAAIFRKIYLAKLLNEGKIELLLNDLNLSDLNEAKNYLKNYNINENSITLLGTGQACREFLHSDDLATACVHFMQNVKFKDCIEDIKKPRNSQINIGSGELVSIKELAFLIGQIINYKGEILFENKSENDGTLKKVADYSKAKALGFDGAKISLKDGLTMMSEWYIKRGGGGG